MNAGRGRLNSASLNAEPWRDDRAEAATDVGTAADLTDVPDSDCIVPRRTRRRVSVLPERKRDGHVRVELAGRTCAKTAYSRLPNVCCEVDRPILKTKEDGQ